MLAAVATVTKMATLHASEAKIFIVTIVLGNDCVEIQKRTIGGNEIGGNKTDNVAGTKTWEKRGKA
jgi:hypothetical protein